MSKPIRFLAPLALIATACTQQGDHDLLIGEAVAQPAEREPEREPDVVFVPTPEPVVKRMLTMAKVGPSDVVYDLGCGDGRIAIAAVKDFKAKKAVCIDIDPERVREARANARKAGVADRVEIKQGDLFEEDLSDATVVTLYLLESLNLKLRPRLHKQLRPGARVVSQSFDMGEWKPDAESTVDNKRVYLWVMPLQQARKRWL